jgi:hypothetical protein
MNEKCLHPRQYAWLVPRYSVADVLSGKVLVTPTSLPYVKIVRCPDCGERS